MMSFSSRVIIASQASFLFTCNRTTWSEMHAAVLEIHLGADVHATRVVPILVMTFSMPNCGKQGLHIHFTLWTVSRLKRDKFNSWYSLLTSSHRLLSIRIICLRTCSGILATVLPSGAMYSETASDRD
jgi:hypothetical protein